jgi:CelD/BcsL family acetyltransferase involved in cellulose biosynthesis
MTGTRNSMGRIASVVAAAPGASFADAEPAAIIPLRIDRAAPHPRSAQPPRPIALYDTWQDRAAWDGFVASHDQSRFCHLFDYGEVVGCYGYRPLRLAFVSEGKLVAALPASVAESIFFGRKLVSQPFSEYGGLLVDPSLSLEEISRVYDLLDDYLARHAQFRVLEMHGNHGIAPHQDRARLAAQNPHHVAVLSLDQPLDALWNKVVQYSVRKGVNKAIANRVEAYEECSETILRERFFPLYLRSMKRLGVPPHSLAYFIGCLEFLGDRLKIFWARRDGEILAGLLGFTCGSRVNITSIVSDADAWKFSPNDAIHWAFIKWAVESGFRFFDFGSVRYEGQRTYKKKWGTVFEEHAHYFLSRDPAMLERSTFSSSSPRMSQLAKLWSNHMPEKVAQLAGPVIRKHLVR